MIYSNILETIGHTPIIKLNNLNLGANAAEIYVKLESFNPGSSVKDRAAFYMLKGLEAEGKIKKGDTIVEATSGNTGIGLAMACAALGYQAIFTMPDSMSIERRKLLLAYGAQLELTPAVDGMKGAIAKAEELIQQDGFHMAGQFINENNVKAHYETTSKEILKDFEELDAFVAGVGTGGTITGVAKRFKEEGRRTKMIAVEPVASPVLSGGEKGSHKIQGIGAGFKPDILDMALVDEVLTVTDDDAIHYARYMGESQGILIGISGGAAFSAAIEVAKRLGAGKKVLFVAPDNGERYLSTVLYGNQE